MKAKYTQDPTLQIFSILDQMFDLPSNLTELTLHLQIDSAPKLTVTFIPDVNTKLPVVKKFEIKEVIE